MQLSRTHNTITRCTNERSFLALLKHSLADKEMLLDSQSSSGDGGHTKYTSGKVK